MARRGSNSRNLTLGQSSSTGNRRSTGWVSPIEYPEAITHREEFPGDHPPKKDINHAGLDTKPRRICGAERQWFIAAAIAAGLVVAAVVAGVTGGLLRNRHDGVQAMNWSVNDVEYQIVFTQNGSDGPLFAYVKQSNLGPRSTSAVVLTIVHCQYGPSHHWQPWLCRILQILTIRMWISYASISQAPGMAWSRSSPIRPTSQIGADYAWVIYKDVGRVATAWQDFENDWSWTDKTLAAVAFDDRKHVLLVGLGDTNGTAYGHHFDPLKYL
ncbi:hypothetical protein FHL15_009899 [Xylaria flabelliformis]|uniref:Uncharacterized protein n=1 Tax=Xylaria flabelliformis TaxID=2512241 RepID=A0A553HMN6_9PEZI|nr:hypothetical protein FHL15_009899 [Xylaria flabelliformis]